MIDHTRYSRYSKGLVPLLKKRKVKAYGMFILSLFTASFFGIFAIRPTVTTIVRLRREIHDKQLVEVALSQKINSLSSLDQIYRSIEGDLSVIEAVLPRQPRVNTLVNLIEGVAVENELGIPSVQFDTLDLISPPSQEKTFQIIPLPFRVSFVSSYPNLVSALNDFNEVNRLVTVETIEISKHREGEGLVLDLHGRGYYVH